MLRVMIVDLWRRTALLQVALASLATLAPLRLAMSVGGIDGNQVSGSNNLLQSSAVAGQMDALLAVLIGLLLGTGVWKSDQAEGHIYALTLPTPRWHYALLRYTSGAVVVGVVVLAFWIGALAAASLVTLPYGLQAYPSALSARFALTALLSFSIFFTLSALTTRTAAFILLAIVFLVIAEVALNEVGAERTLIDLFFIKDDMLLTMGRWMLFDV